MISREKFIERVGREPTQDELAQCNCPEGNGDIGNIGHRFCGWDPETDAPYFIAWPNHAPNYPCATITERNNAVKFRPRNMNEPPFYTMINSGTFWRCTHGVTRFDENGCVACDTEWKEMGHVEIDHAE
jgi:hypothetical protein